MKSQDDTNLSPEALRAFVQSHLVRNPSSDETHLINGWRVKFGRPIYSAEAAALHAVYVEEDAERQKRQAAELATAEARKPKGLARLGTMGWQTETFVGTVLIVGGSYGILGVEQASYIMFVIVGITQGVGLIPLLGLGFFFGRGITLALRALLRIPPGSAGGVLLSPDLVEALSAVPLPA
ncbi:MAG: hypothetical protein EXR58_04395 [Chloroflexi bacterium]|nr:hypothetical protein [Chloroflexota bacterium]